MARIEALGILNEAAGKELLAEEYGKVIESVMVGAVTMKYKNQDLSGTPSSGTVEAKRFVNATAKDYGTARAGAKGDKVKAKPVTVPIDVDREIVEELEDKDTTMYGVAGLLQRRGASAAASMVRELESAYLKVGSEKAIELTFVADTTPKDRLVGAINQLAQTKNQFVDGVPKDSIVAFLSPDFYSSIIDYITEDTNRPHIDSSQGQVVRFRGVIVEESIYMPADVEFEVHAIGSIAQPLHLPQSTFKSQPIPLSMAVSMEMFFNYGTTAVTPDLMLVSKAA